ncbi:MAG: pyridoxal phosphate-dependent aminotransferase [Bacteroidales bacterium]|jgi:cystathionine beta-lyase|nr:pyridoxal phosphate-dependent aminotransferase [Bacteroidales bacterium]
MTYNFDTVIDRSNTYAVKYDIVHKKGLPLDTLPMWVADMDFSAPPEVLADLQRTVAHGIFGYSEPEDAYYNAVIEWFSARFGYRVQQQDIVLSPGLVFGLAQAVRAFTAPGDAVIIQTPVYYPFYNVVRDNGRTLVTNSLLYKNGAYSIDFEDFERKIIVNKVKLFILCSPHNPVGRVWTRADLEQLNAICTAHNVLIISDEIHCDFVWGEHAHTCFALINEDAIVATAPSKTFNLAGLQASNIFVKNETLRKKLSDELYSSGYHQLSTPGIVSCQSAYEKGGAWLDELKRYLEENIRSVQEFLKTRLPQIKLVETQATYLLWLDFSAYGLQDEEINRRIVEDAHLWFNRGRIFGDEGSGFQRINIACPRAIINEALRRLEHVF